MYHFCLHLGIKPVHLYSMPQGFTESSYFSQILKADLDNIKFPEILLCCNMWMICFLLSSGLFTGRQHPLAEAFSMKGT